MKGNPEEISAMAAHNPIFCDIGITEKCLFKCRMCRLWQSPGNEQELSITEWKNFVSSLEGFGSNIRIHIAGGEPLLKDGILELIGFATKKGFTSVMVSNGFLIDEEVAQRIADSGLGVISISLDTLDEEKHDFLRGRPKAGEHAKRAIDYLTKKGARSISILAVIMDPNLGDLTALAEWVNSNSAISSIYFQAVSQPIATPRDQRWHTKEEFGYLWPKDKQRTDAVIDQLISYKKSGYKISNSLRQLEVFKSYFKEPHKLSGGMKCTQGDYVMYLRPTGDVLLCGSMAPIGNVRTQSINEIWFSQEAESRRQEIHLCQESCLNLINCFEDKDLP